MQKRRLSIIIILLAQIMSPYPGVAQTDWFQEPHNKYRLFYKNPDKNGRNQYEELVNEALVKVQQFFGSPMPRTFDVFVHPNRASLDQQWRRDWNMPDFKSECWMVASGIAAKLDLVSPRVWETEACEHHYEDKTKTAQLILHEIVHVYHGQNNPSPDFSEVEGIDWFVEGLATYASGQCDENRMLEVKKGLKSNGLPKSLDQFWQGSTKYGLSGSMVQFIDKEFGRARLAGLMKFRKKQEILDAMGVTEGQLIARWGAYMEK
ncbi:MAG: hypothetical protein JST46_01565 [Bacteroidetes bacterium]|nr:hypothetical protein [Bacteroidota bacterium]